MKAFGQFQYLTSPEAVYPEQVITGHRTFLVRRRALRPAEEYRQPTDQEWEEFLGHFERRRIALGTCGRAYATSCIHEHSCLRCPLLRVDPAQQQRISEIRDNLLARITEAEQQGWLGEVEGLKVSLAAADDKLAQLNRRPTRRGAVHLGMPNQTGTSSAATPSNDTAAPERDPRGR